MRGLLDAFDAILERHNFHFEFHQEVIIILHYVNCVIIPFIAAIIFLQDCGRNWTLFWNQCIDDLLRSKYDISTHIIDYSPYFMEFELMSSNDICETVSLMNITWNECIRSFLYNWSFVMILNEKPLNNHEQPMNNHG